MQSRRLSILLTACVSCVAGAIGCSDASTEREVVKRIPPGEHVVAHGDDLSNISMRAYGRMDVWYALLNANPQLCSRAGFDLVENEVVNIPEYTEIDMSLPKSVFPESLPAKYIVMPGDSLHFIADGCYGDRELWPLIYEANRTILSERVKLDTRQLTAGQELNIPALPKS